MARKIKTSQKIRVILNGVVIYTKVGAIDNTFGSIAQLEAVKGAIHQLAMHEVKCTGLVTRLHGCDVQVDLL